MDTLPIELRLKIVRYLDIEILLSLEYKDEIMWEILRNPTLEKTETWLIEYVSKFGIIYIKDGTYFGLYNINEYKNIEKSINVWDSRLQEGFYKLRFLYQGFDLVKIGNYFLSSQDGPLESFNELKDNEWGTSYKSRGFELVIKVDNGLSIGDFDVDSGIKPILTQIFTNDIDPTFYIVYPYNIFLNSDKVESKLMNKYSNDSVYNHNSPIVPYILKNMVGKVIGYKLQSRIWSAYAVTDEAHSDEGSYNFSVSWYRYSSNIHTNPLIGFIITGSQNDYIYPGIIELIDDDYIFPDRYVK